MSLDRVLLVVAAAALMSGCHLFGKLTAGLPYSAGISTSRPRWAQLKVPTGLDSPNTQGALVIPVVLLAPPPPGKKDACLDVPPRYTPAPPNKAGQRDTHGAGRAGLSGLRLRSRSLRIRCLRVRRPHKFDRVSRLRYPCGRVERWPSGSKGARLESV